MHPNAKSLLRPLCLLALTLSVAFAQRATSERPTGEIQLQIKDSTGTAMEAAGRIESLATGVETSFHTDSSGKYTFQHLAPGRYRLEIERAGFASLDEVVDVPSATPVERNLTMVPGNQSYKLDVVAATPLQGVNLEANQIAAPVQSATSGDLDDSGALDLSAFLNRRLAGVHINEIQGNPVQTDVSYRGYTASPILGTPQGLSVYMDGVRLNQPFGDVVSWDLIPRIAISEITLMPGSNPLFGLNTLGGAISLETKDGQSHPGTSLQISGGSFGRRNVEMEHGGAFKGVSWYLAGNLLFEDGWRDASSSNVRQFFSRFGWQHRQTTIGFSWQFANNQLSGNALQDPRFLARDYSSVYTKPDINRNRTPAFNLTLRHTLNPNLSLSGNIYYRFIRSGIYSADINENSLDQSVYQPSAADIAALTAKGFTGFPRNGANAANTPFPFWRCIAQGLQRDEPGEKCNGLLNTTGSEQRNYGTAGQLTWTVPFMGHRNQLTAGGALDRSTVRFGQSTELAFLNPDRSFSGIGLYADGITGGNINGEPFDARVDLRGLISTRSLYVSDTLTLGSAWNFTVSGRYNHTGVENSDRLTPSGPGSLTGSDAYNRFNPAAGVTFNPSPLFNAYFGYSEGSRAPTSIELGCADPAQPCKLPNSLASDPPLNQVVTRTLEAGFRGSLEQGIHWNAGWFRADNRDDILFVSSAQTGFGYFKNFDKTRRQGAQVSVDARIRRLTVGTGYTFLEATYESTETVNGSSNSTNDATSLSRGLPGSIQINPGARIPLTPRHILKAWADFQASTKLSAELSMNAVSSSLARGNENGLHQADGVYYLGPGISGGYAVVNAGLRYQARSHLQLFADVNNLLNRHYYTGAQLGVAGFNSAGNFIARPFAAVNGVYPLLRTTFFAPGAPIGIWGGVKFSF